MGKWSLPMTDPKWIRSPDWYDTVGEFVPPVPPLTGPMLWDNSNPVRWDNSNPMEWG